MTDIGPVELPWSYWDGVAEVELRADELPYDDDSVSGVQIAMGRRQDGTGLTVRLPATSAMRLALAILGATTPPPPPIEDDPVAKRLGIVPCCDMEHRCPIPDPALRTDPWRCRLCGRLWRLGRACDICDFHGVRPHGGQHEAGNAWRPVTGWRRIAAWLRGVP